MATFSTNPSHSDNDAQQVGSTVTTTGSSVNANNTSDHVGIVFPNVTIAPGSTISVCTVTLNFPSGSFDDPDLTIYGIDEDNTNSFNSGTSNDISVRAKTTATASWVTTGLGTGPEVGPSLVSLAQEVINRAGWASGNALGFVYVANSNSSNFRVNAYDNGADYPILDITYTAPSSGQPTRSLHQFRQRGF